MIVKRRVVDFVRYPLALVVKLKDHYIGDVILSPHVAYRPFNQNVLEELKAKHNYQHVPLSSKQGLIKLVLARTGLNFTDLALRRRVLQREQGSSRTMNTESNYSQFNFS